VQALSSSNQGLVGRILVDLRKNIETTRAAQQARIDEENRIEAERQAKLKVEKDAAEAVRQARMPLAEIGLKTLLDLGQSEEIQSIIRLQQESDREVRDDDMPMEPSILLYFATRASGEAWETMGKSKRAKGTRDVCITFRSKALFIQHGCESIDFEQDIFPYDSTTEEQLKRRLSFYYCDYDQDALKAMKVQWENEWWPKHLIFQVLMDCADPAKLQYYLSRGLTELAKGYRRI
jgi:hypothetical protein